MVSGKRIAKARTADIEAETALAEKVADATGRRMLLMQDDQNGCGHRGGAIQTSTISLLTRLRNVYKRGGSAAAMSRAKGLHAPEHQVLRRF